MRPRLIKGVAPPSGPRPPPARRSASEADIAAGRGDVSFAAAIRFFGISSVGRRESAEGGTLRVVGVDEWAWRRGAAWGTILVDLETRTVADVLPDRSSTSLATWLSQHPGVEIVCRDRHGLYAEGARVGTPQARQVADCFHLVLKRLLTAA